MVVSPSSDLLANQRETIAAVLAAATAELAGASRLTGSIESTQPSSAALEAQILIAHALGQSRAWLWAHPEALLTPVVAARFSALLARRLRGEPVAYLTGQREFWSLALLVSPAVLVPRPETELLVERALAVLSAPTAEVAELGTGSGAVALALAKERPGWNLVATDISSPALAVAAGNAARLHLPNVRFLAGAWFQPLSGRRFDLIVSNPPYIGESDPALLDPALMHEPRMALVSGASGLEGLTQIIVAAADHLAVNGWLILEHGSTQARQVADLLVARGLRHVRCHRDLAGAPRVSEAQRA